MYNCFGVNKHKQYASLARGTKIPRVNDYEYEDNCLEDMAEDCLNEVSSTVNSLKDKIKNFKESVSMEMGIDDENINISCGSHNYCLKKKTLALATVGTLAFVLGLKSLRNR